MDLFRTKPTVTVAVAACLLAGGVTGSGIEPQEFSVQVTARVQAVPAQIALQWPGSAYATGYLVSRKTITEQSWTPLATLPAQATGFTDNSVVLGAAYEYEIAQSNTDGPKAYGYIYSGIEVPFPGSRGRVVLIVDSTHAGGLAAELNRLSQDLVGDGWTVLRHDVSRGAAPADVRSVIWGEYQADPANTKAVFLFGHVPVPYSGDLNPDMHPAHRGAWPADVFYGNMEGAWTDSSVNSTGSEDPRNFNVPGDGKFDQSDIPGPVVLEVGRVDLSNLPAFAPRTEEDLLRQYLDKNHNFRHKVFWAEPRAVLRDNFGEIQGDAPATDAWRAFAPFFGPEQIRVIGPNDFFSALGSGSYLWAYGGGGGEYYQADTVGSTTDFAQQRPQCVFFMLHGSYFGDWDSWDNFLRAALASPGYGLAAAWTGLPHWYVHPMALGETIGLSTMITQNNRGLYKNQVNLSVGQVHIALMGDPTLRMHVVAPPANLSAQPSGGSVVLNWTPSPESVRGYYVYRAGNAAGPFARLARTYLSSTSYVDTAPPPGPKTYMVRALRLETSASGSYFNPSQGIFASVGDAGGGSGDVLPVVAVEAINPTAQEDGGIEGDFVVTRAGPASSALAVTFTVGGTAVNGTDYEAISNTVFIPPNATDAWIPIKPNADGATEGNETVTLTIAPSPEYIVGSAGSATMVIRDQPVDHPPVAQDDAVAATNDVPLPLPASTLLANDTDPDPGDELRVTAVDSSSQQGGSVSLAGPLVVYKPPSGYAGPDTFRYTVQDSSGASASAVVRITVAPPGRIASIVRRPDGLTLLGLEGAAGRSYAVEASQDFVSWSVIGTGVFNGTESTSFSDSGAKGARSRFYRIQWQ